MKWLLTEDAELDLEDLYAYIAKFDARRRRDLYTLMAGFWILRQESQRPLQRVVTALRRLDTKLRHARMKRAMMFLFGRTA